MALDLSSSTTSAYPVYTTGTTRTTTHYAKGSVILLTYADGAWRRADYNSNTNSIADTYCATTGTTTAKAATHTGYVLKANSYIIVTLTNANDVQGPITLNVNSKGAKPIYINGNPSSATNHTLPAGTYLVYYDGVAYHFRTDGKIPGDISGDAATVGGHTVQADVPDGAKFTDTTYTFDSNTGLVTNGTTISIGTVPVSHGGTGTTSLASGQVLIGNGTSAVTTRGIDTTSGGTASSTSLITSGAVYEALINKVEVGAELSYTPAGTIIATATTNNPTYTPGGSLSTQSFYGAAGTVNVEGTPAGTVSINPFTPTGTVTSVFTGIPETISFSGETGALQINSFSYTPGGSITGTATNANGNYTPTGTIGLTGFPTQITVEGKPAGSITISTAASGTANYTPKGTVTSTFTGTPVTASISGENTGISVGAHTYTPAGSITATDTTGNGTYTPKGSVTITAVSVTGKPEGNVTSTFTGTGVRLVGIFSGTTGTVTVSGETTGVSATVTTSSASIYPMTGMGTLPTLTMTVSNEILSYSWSQGALPTQSTVAINALTSVGVSIEQGGVTASGNFKPAGTVTIGTGTGTANYTPSGTIVSVFDGDNFALEGSATATFTGSAANFTFSGTQSTLTHAVEQGSFVGTATVTAAGTITSTFSGTGAILTGTFSGEDMSSSGSFPTSIGATFYGGQAKFAFTGTSTTFSPSAEGTSFEVSTVYTPAGTVTSSFIGSVGTLSAVFIGENLSSSGSFTPTGTIQKATFTGSGATFTFSGIPATFTL